MASVKTQDYSFNWNSRQSHEYNIVANQKLLKSQDVFVSLEKKHHLMVVTDRKLLNDDIGIRSIIHDTGELSLNQREKAYDTRNMIF